jgi:hypothetical protein
MQYKIEHLQNGTWRPSGGSNRLGIARAEYKFKTSTGHTYRLRDTEANEVLFTNEQTTG